MFFFLSHLSEPAPGDLQRHPAVPGGAGAATAPGHWGLVV